MGKNNIEKIFYGNSQHAKRAIKEHKKKYDQEMRKYRCKCDGTKHYHLTSQTKVRAIIMRAGKIIEEII